jgi:hypothetical protein
LSAYERGFHIFVAADVRRLTSLPPMACVFKSQSLVTSAATSRKRAS